jgi:hydrogenase expression/formation protein HypC
VCLAIPGRIVALEGWTATVDLAGNTLRVDVSLIETPAVGEWVVVHAGFALEKVDERAAYETLDLARQLAQPASGDRRAKS